MSSRLLIRYAGPGAPVSWLALNERGRPLAGVQSGDAPPATAVAAAGDVIVIVPGSDVLLATTRVAARSREQLARAVPFALEEQFAEPVEQLHVAFTVNADGGQDVAAIRADTLRAWLADLARRGVQPDWLVPEPLALEHVAGQVTVLVDDDAAIARLARHDGVVLPTAQLPELLALADVPRDADGRIGVLMADMTGTAPVFGSGFIVQRVPPVDSALAVFARGLAGPALAALPNLASGAFAPAHRGAGARRLWRVAAILAVSTIVLGFAGALADRWSLARRAAALDAAMLAVYRDVYPDGRVVPDLAARMKSDYAGARGGGATTGPLSLLATVAPVIAQDTRIAVKGLEYRGGTLDITLLAPGVQALDGARESAAQLPGVQVELASASTNERGAEGRLRVVARAR